MARYLSADRVAASLGIENVDPVVGRIKGTRRICGAWTVAIDAVGHCTRALGCVEWRIIHPRASEESSVVGIVPHRREVGGSVDGMRADRNRVCKGDLLPARGALRSRLRGRYVDPGTSVRPQVAHVLTGVRRRLVEADAQDVPVRVR